MGVGQDEPCQDCPSGADNGCCLHAARTMCSMAATDGKGLSQPLSVLKLPLAPWKMFLNNMVTVNLPIVAKYPIKS